MINYDVKYKTIKVSSQITKENEIESVYMRLIITSIPQGFLKISGIKLVIYDRQSTQNIGIDITGDSKSDLFTSFFVRVNDILSYHDALAPSEVFNFT